MVILVQTVLLMDPPVFLVSLPPLLLPPRPRHSCAAALIRGRGAKLHGTFCIAGCYYSSEEVGLPMHQFLRHFAHRPSLMQNFVNCLNFLNSPHGGATATL